ncbi:MAG: hypothetical protein ACLRFM_01120 [Alphaproteobacteria bacterium]
MLNRCGRFFVFCLIATCGVVRAVCAAPTVRKFGMPTSASDGATTNKQSMIKMSTANKIAAAVPVVKTTNTPTNNTDANAVNIVSKTPGADGARLSGLFHGNIIKGIGTKLSTNYASPSGGNTSGATSELSQRINDLENALDAKQEALKSGNGIYIDGKTIGLSQEMANLPEKLQEINQEIDDLNEKFSGTNFEQIQQIIDNIQNNTTIYDSGTQEYKRVTIVDDFDEQDFINKQQGSVK